MHDKLTHLEPAIALAKKMARDKKTTCTIVAANDLRCKVHVGVMTSKEALDQNVMNLYYVNSYGDITDCITRQVLHNLIRDMPEKNKGRFVCGVIGHPLLVHIKKKGTPEEARFCTRCGDQVVHSSKQIEIGVNIQSNRRAFAELGWRHKLAGVQTPFGPKYRTNNF